MLFRRVFLLTIEIGRDFLPKVAPPSYKLVHNNLPVRLYLKPNSCRGHFRTLNWGTYHVQGFFLLNSNPPKFYGFGTALGS